MWNTWERTVCRVLMGRPERKSSFGRLRHIGEDNMNTVSQKWDGRVWT
jgi:hypothetical protein